MARESFALYTEHAEHIQALTDEQAGQLLKAIMSHASDIESPPSDAVAAMAYSFIRARMDRDAEREQEISDSRREAGKKGGRPRKANDNTEKQNKAKKANGFFAFSEKANESKEKQPENDQYILNNNKNIKEKENSRKGVREKEEISEPSSTSRDQTDYPYREIVDHLNAKAGTAYRATSEDTRKHIRGRFGDGYTLEDFFSVINKKVAEWKGTDMSKYLRPSTLFGPKFEAYLNQQEGEKSEKKNAFRNFEERDYDFSELQKKLINV